VDQDQPPRGPDQELIDLIDACSRAHVGRLFLHDASLFQARCSLSEPRPVCIALEVQR
jgi:hypothetical protein